MLACAAEEQKCCKYSSLLSSYIFAPVCIETLEHGEKVLEILSARLVPEYEKPLASQDRPYF